MPYFIVTLIVYLCNMALFANNPTQQLTTTIDQVTVYLNGANVHQSTTTQLLSGKTEVVLVGLPFNLRQENTHIKVSGASILSAAFKPFDEENTMRSAYPPALKVAQDSVDFLWKTIKSNQYEHEALNSEKEMILQNKTVGGSQSGLSVAELQKAADFYRTRLKDIADRIATLEQSNQTLEIKKNIISKRIMPEVNRLQAQNKQTHIHLLLDNPTTANAQIEINYTVYYAQWQASYTLKTIDINQPIQLNYQAQIYNNTGVDWNNVQLTLVVGSIQDDATLPVLEAWLLNYDSPSSQNRMPSDLNFQRSNVAQNFNGANHNAVQIQDEELGVSNLNAEFVIPIRYSIPANSIPYLVDIAQHQLNAEYTHICIPKLDNKVYLIAQIVDWEDLNLVNGKASLYYGNSYIGTSQINLNTLRDTLRLSLGTDSKVQCTKLKIKDKSNKKLLNLMYRESFAYTIATKNNRNKPINIEIWDQVPVSQEKDITVDIEEISGAQLDAPSGKLVWRLDVAPAKTESLSVEFNVKYPSNKSVQIRKSRSIHTPRHFLP
ncbi:MAG: DUF4139 domain-containing protein [Chitinophagales bacterium]|nr:DUF4139 domain-containing protein [Chitinophagales bacterium]